MPDLFLIPDERTLLAKWDFLSSVFRIVSRDYVRVLTGDILPDHHRTILIQVVSDLIDLEADVRRMGKDSPSEDFADDTRAVWLAAADWVRELRAWRFPHDSMAVSDIEDSLVRRKEAEERFKGILTGGEPVDGPTILI
ncbi:MAG: hypothetical protein MUF18_00870 [Fimbriiglobus sp.]|jgi:hypothetical protein|nr:hypothetical protein [Fimbriiglobus sp.]